MRGFRWTGNETNILASNFYPTKEGLLRKIRNWDGISSYREKVEPFHLGAGDRCEVTASAEWKLRGEGGQAKATFVVRVNRGMQEDAVKGKAESKLRREVLFILGEPPVDIVDPESIEVESQVLDDSEYEDKSENEESRAISGMLRKITGLMNVEHISVFELRDVCAGDKIPRIPIQLADITKQQLEHLQANWSNITDRVHILRKEKQSA